MLWRSLLDQDFPNCRDFVPEMAEDADTDYYETVEIHEREFQRYSIENAVYFVPVDIVSSTPCHLSTCAVLAHRLPDALQE